MAEVIKVKGLRELSRVLRVLPNKIRDKVLYGALRKGANIIRDDAISRVHVGESKSFMRRGKFIQHVGGRIRDNIKVRREKKKYIKDQAHVRVGVDVNPSDKDAPWYWRFIEFGTVKMGPRPFLVPAYESKKYEADNVIKKAVRLGVLREAKKLKRK